MEVQKPGDDQSAYQREVQQGVKIFEESFKGMQTAKFPAQKAEYEKSTHEALQGIQDACKGLMNEHLNGVKDQLSKDYQAYLDNPNTENQGKVQHDIDDMKHTS